MDRQRRPEKSSRLTSQAARDTDKNAASPAQRSRTAQESARAAAHKSGAQTTQSAQSKSATVAAKKLNAGIEKNVQAKRKPQSQRASAASSSNRERQVSSRERPVSSRERQSSSPEREGGEAQQRRSRSSQQAVPVAAAASSANNQRSKQASSRSSSVSERSSADSARASARSSRSSARSLQSPGKGPLIPIIIGLVLIGLLGCGLWFAQSGADAQATSETYLQQYNKYYDYMQESIEETDLDAAKTYYAKGVSALDAADAFNQAHPDQISTPSNSTDKQRAEIMQLYDRLPFLEKVLALKQTASALQGRAQQAIRTQDLDALDAEIQDFLSNPKIDGISLDADAQKLFRKRVSFLEAAPALISAERERRQQRFTKPDYPSDTRNDVQKRKQRIAYQSLASNVPRLIKEQKFAAAYKTVLLFHSQHPPCNVDQEWRDISTAEDAYWSQEKSEIEGLLAQQTSADTQAAINKLIAFFDRYGNETYGDEARELYKQALAAQP